MTLCNHSGDLSPIHRGDYDFTFCVCRVSKDVLYPLSAIFAIQKAHQSASI